MSYRTLRLGSPKSFGDLVAAIWPAAVTWSLTIQEELGSSEGLHRFVDSLKGDLVAIAMKSEWPGTRLVDGLAEVRSYKCTDHCLRLLLAAGKSLDRWLQPSLPEDLALYRADGTVLLESISHEGDVIVRLSEMEVGDLPESVRNKLA